MLAFVNSIKAHSLATFRGRTRSAHVRPAGRPRSGLTGAAHATDSLYPSMEGGYGEKPTPGWGKTYPRMGKNLPVDEEKTLTPPQALTQLLPTAIYPSNVIDFIMIVEMSVEILPI